MILVTKKCNVNHLLRVNIAWPLFCIYHSPIMQFILDFLVLPRAKVQQKMYIPVDARL